MCSVACLFYRYITPPTVAGIIYAGVTAARMENHSPLPFIAMIIGLGLASLVLSAALWRVHLRRHR